LPTLHTSVSGVILAGLLGAAFELFLLLDIIKVKSQLKGWKPQAAFSDAATFGSISHWVLPFYKLTSFCLCNKTNDYTSTTLHYSPHWNGFRASCYSLEAKKQNKTDAWFQSFLLFLGGNKTYACFQSSFQ
jgi:hypothetical protein